RHPPIFQRLSKYRRMGRGASDMSGTGPGISRRLHKSSAECLRQTNFENPSRAYLSTGQGWAGNGGAAEKGGGAHGSARGYAGDRVMPDRASRRARGSLRRGADRAGAGARRRGPDAEMDADSPG